MTLDRTPPAPRLQEARHEERLRRVGKAAASELRRFVWMFLYLWVLFGLFALHEELVLSERGIRFAPAGIAVVNALVLGKVMLVAEDLKLGHRIRPRPLIWPVLLDALILALLFVVVHKAEHAIGGLVAGESLAASVPHIGNAGLPGLLIVALILFVALVPFFAFRHISDAIGRERMREVLLGARGGGQATAAPVADG
jgi:hypothetical protein